MDASPPPLERDDDFLSSDELNRMMDAVDNKSSSSSSSSSSATASTGASASAAGPSMMAVVPASDFKKEQQQEEVDDLSDEMMCRMLDKVEEQKRTYALLTEGQKSALQELTTAPCVFLTGRAGAGKSFLTRHFVKHYGDGLEVTSSTGESRNNLVERDESGAPLWAVSTIHSWSGMGIGNRSEEYYVDDIRQRMQRYLKDPTDPRNAVAARFARVKTLKIDEAPLLTSSFFRKLVARLRAVRAHNMPRIILVGDFLQRTPVVPAPTDDDPVKLAEYYENLRPLFATKTWRHLDPRYVELTESKRQNQADQCKMLNEIRVGQPSPDTWEFMRQRVTTLEKETKMIFSAMAQNPFFVPPVYLNGYNSQVADYNTKFVEQIKHPVVSLCARAFYVEVDQQTGVPYGACIYQLGQFCPAFHDQKQPPPAPKRGTFKDIAAPNAFVDQLSKLVEQTLKSKKMAGVLQLKKTCSAVCVKNLDAERCVQNGTGGSIMSLPAGVDDTEQMKKFTVPHRKPFHQLMRLTEFTEMEHVRSGKIKVQLRDSKTYDFTECVERVPLDPADELLEIQYWKRMIVVFQYPLKPGMGMSVASIQGLTIPDLMFDMGSCFAAGDVYGCMSRPNDITRLKIINFVPARLKVRASALRFYNAHNPQLYPLNSKVPATPADDDDDGWEWDFEGVCIANIQTQAQKALGDEQIRLLQSLLSKKNK